jgi:hypothetical protein
MRYSLPEERDYFSTLMTSHSSPKAGPPLSSSIRFESNFESGNLYAAYRVDDSEYNLVLSNDVNTKGYTQWFFFSVEGARGPTVLNILNMSKSTSLFQKGMRPLVYAGEGWKRDGCNVLYYQNNIIRDE